MTAKQPNERIYNKLVRDRIPEIIASTGDTAVARVLDEAQYRTELERKLMEECGEALQTDVTSERLEELADILEAVTALAALEGATFDEVAELARQKREKRGGFGARIFLEKVF